MSEIENQPTISYKGVLYADGGYYSNEKAGGWGLHGYVFDANSLPTKGSGSKATPSHEGYLETKDEKQAVAVVNYVDSFGGIPQARDNNHAELVAVKNALEYALEKNLEHTQIYSDSKLIVNGVNQYIHKWKQNGFLNSNGNEVPYKEDWLAVDALLQSHKDRGSEVMLAWIKGHNGALGNEMADQWATKGNCLGSNGYNYSFKMEREPEGYWKKAPGYNRIVDQPKWYFSSAKDERRQSACGRHMYWTGHHGKDDEDIAKPQSDSSNSVIYTKEPIDVLERVRDHFIEQDKQQVGHLFVGVLRNIFNPDVTSDIMQFGLDVFRKNRVGLSLTTSKRMPVIHHVNPTGLAYYNVENLDHLTSILDRHIAQDKALIVTDITDLLYEPGTEKNPALKLKKEISNTIKHLDVDIKYNTSLAPELRAMTGDIPTKKAKVRLVMGTDIIGRNALASLADQMVGVKILSWRESDTVFRFATVVETKDDIGIWANPFGNFKLVS